MADVEEHGGGEDLYDGWDVDNVDLDFKSVSVLQSLLSDRKSSLSQNLYKMSQQIDAKLRKQLKPLNSNLLLVNSTAPTSPPLLITHSQANAIKENASQSSTMSSKNSFQEFSSAVYSLSSNESSTLFEDQDSSLFGSAKIFPTYTTLNSSYGNTFIHIGFLVLLLLIVFLVIKQCRAAFKQRSQDRGMLPHSSPSQLFSGILSGSTSRRNLGNPVEVDSLNNIQQHHMQITPISPVSILQNSPLYSPVKDPPCSPSISLPSPLIHEESNEGFEMENYNVHIVAEEEEVEMTTMWSSADSDEGIESEEDIDGSAFKQLILLNAGEEENLSKSYGLVSSYRDREEVWQKRSSQFDPHEFKIRQNNSLESPSMSLSSAGNLSSFSPPSLNQEMAGINFWKIVRAASEEECLI